MDRVAHLPERDRDVLFGEAASRKRMTPAVVEKDFWVCFLLQKLFSDGDISKHLLFKGGTSLSKVYGLLDRFSEDIDLVLEWKAITEEDPFAQRSNKKQEQFIEEQRRRAGEYVLSSILPMLKREVGDICTLTPDQDDPGKVEVRYPGTFSSGYLKPAVLLEIGPIAGWLPNEAHSIQPYAAEVFPEQFKVRSCNVLTVAAERTFWEKVLILHKEAHRSNSAVLPRASRHYYDVMRMARSPVRKSALGKLNILADVADFVQRFYPSAWARFELAKPGTMKLVPSSEVEAAHRRDYNEMQEMIYGEKPTFDEILGEIETLEREINALPAIQS